MPVRSLRCWGPLSVSSTHFPVSIVITSTITTRLKCLLGVSELLLIPRRADQNPVIVQDCLIVGPQRTRYPLVHLKYFRRSIYERIVTHSTNKDAITGIAFIDGHTTAAAVTTRAEAMSSLDNWLTTFQSP
jgi:hypothetical protein